MARRVVQTLPQMFVETVVDEESSKIAVAAYARVSTEKEEQEDSFERQVEHYTQMINAKPEWRLVKIYADPGISGTRAEKRPDFMRMIEDCRAGKIQKVLVKSISRFARNTVDSLTYIRELKDLGISICFESENIDTMTPGGEVLITILSAMAEQESRTISSNIKWAWQRKFQNGDIILNTGLMLGYRKIEEKDEEGHEIFEINEEEAEIVRRIYREYIAGTSITRICRNLEADGIKTKLGKDKWQYSVVHSILTNEKYTGNATLGKTYKADVLSKKRTKNDGKKAPIYYVEDTHPAIIDRDTFNLIQKELHRRQDAKDNAVGRSRYNSRYPFSGLLICGLCGHKMRRHMRTVGSGKKVAYWGCSNRVVNGREVCDSHHVREDVLEMTYQEAMRSALESASDVTDAIRLSADAVLAADSKVALEQVENEIIEIQEAALALHKAKQRMEITPAEYAAKVKEYSETMKEKEAIRDQLQDESIKYTEIRTWLEAFDENIRTGNILTAKDSEIMRTIVERIVVKDDGIEVYLKCGVSIGQEFIQ